MHLKRKFLIKLKAMWEKTRATLSTRDFHVKMCLGRWGLIFWSCYQHTFTIRFWQWAIGGWERFSFCPPWAILLATWLQCGFCQCDSDRLGLSKHVLENWLNQAWYVSVQMPSVSMDYCLQLENWGRIVQFGQIASLYLCISIHLEHLRL